MAQPNQQIPLNYRHVQPGDMTAAWNPYQRQAWLWVHFHDPERDETWTVTGSGVFLDSDVILTCAHIFALDASIEQVHHVSAQAAHNAVPTSPGEPSGGLLAEAVFACPAAFTPKREEDVFDPAWDLALVGLAAPSPPRNTPPFSLFADPHLGNDPAFQGQGSQLKTVGYGGPDGLMIEASVPLLEVQLTRHWLEADRQMAPGQSGAPIFCQGQDEHGRAEFRVVGVVSCDDKNAPQQSIAAMITDETMAWLETALRAWQRRKVEQAKLQRGETLFIWPG
jgi:Trypsin-like peptidase domain